MMKALVIPISLALLGGTAHADQCAWVDAAVAHEAQALLANAPMVIEFCEPCGDQAPGEPVAAKTVEIATPQGDYRELRVNGKPVDLAYLFVKTDATHYRNVAAMTGCPATDVSPSLQIEAETDHGVLITPDDDQPPPPPTAVTEIPPARPPVAARVPSAPSVYVYSTVTKELSWLAMALAGFTGFVLGSGLVLVLLGVRRRRDMRPRAADLSRAL